MAKRKQTQEQRRALKLQVFELLADEISASQISRVTGVNKGSVSRYRRSAEFATWLAKRNDAPDVMAVAPQVNQRGTTPTDNPEQRGRFLLALRRCGRVDVAAAHSKATPEQVATWLIEQSGEASAAHAEAFLRGTQVIAALMIGKDTDGNSLDVKPADRLRAAVEFVKLTDFGKAQPQPMINIDLRAADQQSVDPIEIIDQALRDQWAKAEHIDLMATE